MKFKLNAANKTFIQGDTKINALKDVTLKIIDNSLNIIIGPSGAGKSTLISLASLLEFPTSGEVSINGILTMNLSESERSLIRRQEIGVIYQRDNLLPYLTVLENVSVPQIVNSKGDAETILKKVGLTEIDKFPSEISLLDQQKTALARALVNNPSILLADEPTGELNQEETKNYLELMAEFTVKTAILVVSNNPELEEYFDNVFYLSEGKLNKKKDKKIIRGKR
jgi:putative ABC transport system ATP-binding protein